MLSFLPKRLFLVILTITFTISACNLGKSPGANSQVSEPTPTSTPQTAAEVQGACSNSLFPVITGATWTYKSKGGYTGDYRFKNTIAEVREDGFTLDTQIDDAATSQEWTCKPEGLAALSLGNGMAAGVNVKGLELDLTTNNIQGVILPKTISAGDQWPFSLDFEGTMELSGLSVDTTGTGTFSFNAIREESVKVPAGTFNAMKIHMDMTLDMQITFSGANTPATLTSSSDIWFAPNIGWVKSNTTGEIMGSATNEIIELQEYSFP
jgi:DUF3108-like